MGNKGDIGNVVGANFGEATTKFNIGGVPVTLLKCDMLDVPAQACMVSQFSTQAATGGLAKAVRDRHGNYNDVAFAKALDLMNNDLSRLLIVPVTHPETGYRYYNCITASTGPLMAGLTTYAAVEHTLRDAMKHGIQHMLYHHYQPARLRSLNLINRRWLLPKPFMT